MACGAVLAQRTVLIDLAGIAHYPDDISGWRLAELLSR